MRASADMERGAVAVASRSGDERVSKLFFSFISSFVVAYASFGLVADCYSSSPPLLLVSEMRGFWLWIVILFLFFFYCSLVVCELS